MAWVIYKHTLLVGDRKGWSYIGQTSKTKPERRWGSGGNNYKKNSFFYAEIQKHGWDAFSHEILEEGITTRTAANKAEQYWIDHYRTFVGFDDCKGFNLTPGGGSYQYRITNSVNETILAWEAELDKYLLAGWWIMDPLEYKRWFRRNSESYVLEKQRKREAYQQNIEAGRQKQRDYYAENAEKIRQRSRDAYKKDGKERYQKNRASRLASNKAYYAKLKDTAEYKQKHAEANKKWWEKKRLLESNREVNVKLPKPRKSDYRHSAETRKKMSENCTRCRAVRCVETGQVFRSAEDAFKQLNIRHIAECCKNTKRTTGGYHWEYV